MNRHLAALLGLTGLLGPSAKATEPTPGTPEPPTSIPASIPARARLSDGFSYRQESLPEGPWSVHVVRIRRDRPDLGLQVLLGGGANLGVSTLSRQASAFPRSRGRALADLNGDFFARGGPCLGDPEGLCLRDGELISAPNGKSAFWIGADRSFHLGPVVSLLSMIAPDGTTVAIGLNEERQDRPVLYTPALGTRTPSAAGIEGLFLPEPGTSLPIRPGLRAAFRVASIHRDGNVPIPAGGVVLSLPPRSGAGHPPLEVGAVWTLSTATQPDLRGATTAIGGGPALLKDGKPTGFQSSDARHPRSAIGWNSGHFFLVQVDGRQPGVSVGMSLAELATHLAGLGCTEALNLDGGGSSTLWARGQVMNSPCEGGERPMGNALLISLEDGLPAPKDRPTP
jgi:hypothetical protein